MNRKSGWFLPLVVLVTCAPCLLVPIVAALFAAGAFGGALEFLGVPWVIALILAVLVGATLLSLHMRRAVCSPERSHR